MSIVPYVPATMGDPIGIGPIALTAAVLVVTWLITELETQQQQQQKQEKQQEQEMLLITDKKEKFFLEHPLDAQIMRTLSEADKPLTAREILKQISLSEKSQINSRLYTLLNHRKLSMRKTTGAPQWSI